MSKIVIAAALFTMPFAGTLRAAAPDPGSAPLARHAQQAAASGAHAVNGAHATMNAGKSRRRRRTPPTLDLAAPDSISHSKEADGVPPRNSGPHATQPAVELPDLGTAGEHREPTKVEAIVAHARRDGLPVVTLLENSSTLVHIGLDPHAKPGLWVVQRVP